MAVDSMEINKGVAAVLVAGIAFMGATLLGDALVTSPTPKVAAIKVDVPTGKLPLVAADTGPPPSILPLLASADPAAGEATTKKLCVACHSFGEGAKAGVGPNLYGVVGLPHGHMEGYSYSAAMMKMHDKPWTFDDLNAWLLKPMKYMPGTKMGFAGLASIKDRANIIAYLDQNSKNPVPLPAEGKVVAPANQKGNPDAGNQGASPAPGQATPTIEGANSTQPRQTTGDNPK